MIFLFYIIFFFYYSETFFTNHPYRGSLNDGLFWLQINNKLPKYNGNKPIEQWFTQKLDHFDLLNTKTWQQRYFINDTFWIKNGPIFVMLGGEGPINENSVTGHFVINEYAKLFNALIISIEHRFYGKSIPTKDLSTENLKYLSSQQALADFAYFHDYINEKYNCPNCKWVVFGGSYSGSLSAWFRLKYPHLSIGSIATSAPVKAQLDFPEYNEVVQKSLEYFSGLECPNRIKRATELITQMLTNKTEKQKLETIFNTCSPIITEDDISLFFSNLEGGIAEIVQYNNDNNQYTPMNIKKLCEIITTGDDILAAYANFNQQFNNFSGINCTQVKYSDYIAEYKDVRPWPQNENAAGRAWTYQTCTEFGYFQTGESFHQPFSPTISLKWYQRQCSDIFGIETTPQNPMPNINWTNIYYGSTNLRGSNIVLPNGSIDPWHILGVKTPPVPSETTIYIVGTAHCADLYPSRDDDLLALTQARKTEIKLISQWLTN